jgi:hypothetical protein
MIGKDGRLFDEKQFFGRRMSIFYIFLSLQLQFSNSAVQFVKPAVVITLRKAVWAPPHSEILWCLRRGFRILGIEAWPAFAKCFAPTDYPAFRKRLFQGCSPVLLYKMSRPGWATGLTNAADKMWRSFIHCNFCRHSA